MKETVNKGIEAIVMGTSSGGIDTLEKIFRMLPRTFNIPIIIVLHRGESPDAFSLTHFNSLCYLSVCEDYDKDPIQNGRISIAPPRYHLMMEMDRTFSLSVDPPINWSRPSIDILFDSAAEAFRETLAGVIMTGANNHGSKGLAKTKKAGGLCIVQDPESAASSQMPRSALKMAAPDHTLTIEDIGRFLITLDANKGVLI